jgi:hypothetical protein
MLVWLLGLTNTVKNESMIALADWSRSMLCQPEHVLNWRRNQEQAVYTMTSINVVVPGDRVEEASKISPVITMEIRPGVKGNSKRGEKINNAKG